MNQAQPRLDVKNNSLPFNKRSPGLLEISSPNPVFWVSTSFVEAEIFLTRVACFWAVRCDFLSPKEGGFSSRIASKKHEKRQKKSIKKFG